LETDLFVATPLEGGAGFFTAVDGIAIPMNGRVLISQHIKILGHEILKIKSNLKFLMAKESS
jgi:hypothetical protein